MSFSSKLVMYGNLEVDLLVVGSSSNVYMSSVHASSVGVNVIHVHPHSLFQLSGKTVFSCGRIGVDWERRIDTESVFAEGFEKSVLGSWHSEEVIESSEVSLVAVEIVHIIHLKNSISILNCVVGRVGEPERPRNLTNFNLIKENLFRVEIVRRRPLRNQLRGVAV